MTVRSEILWRCGARTFVCGRRTLIAGILNVTPDSFSDGGRFFEPRRAAKRALEMVEAGADIVDVGGESSRPGAKPVTTEEEIRRVVPVIEAIRRSSDASISIDTTKVEVARRAIDAGAEIVNDITALRGDRRMARLVAETGVGLILMHMKGTPRTMQKAPRYRNAIEEIAGFLERRAAAARKAGVATDRICLDPGIGFGKTVEHNLQLIAAVARFRSMGYPVLIGASRKSFIGKLTGAEAGDRLEASLAVAAIAILRGADILRVHDVAETARAARLADALKPYCAAEAAVAE
ncbi:dihydropteroate synthase [Candidatus Sumerlaeota bacterium]|nr:dihydropteroate synthase [Candidatus Sumerlaeota bacterium]